MCDVIKIWSRHNNRLAGIGFCEGNRLDFRVAFNLPNLALTCRKLSPDESTNNTAQAFVEHAISIAWTVGGDYYRIAISIAESRPRLGQAPVCGGRGRALGVALHRPRVCRGPACCRSRVAHQIVWLCGCERAAMCWLCRRRRRWQRVRVAGGHDGVQPRPTQVSEEGGRQ